MIDNIKNFLLFGKTPNQVLETAKRESIHRILDSNLCDSLSKSIDELEEAKKKILDLARIYINELNSSTDQVKKLNARNDPEELCEAFLDASTLTRIKVGALYVMVQEMLKAMDERGLEKHVSMYELLEELMEQRKKEDIS